MHHLIENTIDQEKPSPVRAEKYSMKWRTTRFSPDHTISTTTSPHAWEIMTK